METQRAVVVVGSVNVDLVVVADRLPQPGETVLGDDLVRHGGGKGANAAVAAARCGAEVRFVGAVGDDDHGRWSAGQLAAEGIDTAALSVVQRATGVALIVVNRGGENQIAVAGGANAAVDAALVRSALAGLDPASVGCVLASAEVPAAGLTEVGRWARRHGVFSVLNPAPMTAEIVALISEFDATTPNESELALLAEMSAVHSTSTIEVARSVARSSGTTLVVTVGARGSLVVSPSGEAIEVPALPVEVVDTTGAGDTLNGVFAAGLAGGLGAVAAARRATVAASLSVTGAGARGGMPSAAAIAAALDGGR